VEDSLSFGASVIATVGAANRTEGSGVSLLPAWCYHSEGFTDSLTDCVAVAAMQLVQDIHAKVVGELVLNDPS
jgi:hypothetical protein